jgi:hypothetical protein
MHSELGFGSPEVEYQIALLLLLDDDLLAVSIPGAEC